MSKPITGKITTSTWHQKRSNGDIYVWERQTQYVPETRKTKELSRRLLGKIPAGSTDGKMVPTRPKRKASPKPIGISKLLTWIGKESGITEDLLASTDSNTAQKIETLVHFWLFNMGERISEIENFQIFHPTPYKKTMDVEVCTDLFTQLGKEKELFHKYFQARAKRCDIHNPTVFEFCNNRENNDAEELKTVFLMFWDLHNRQPFAFTHQTKLFENPPVLENSFKQMSFLGNQKAEELVTDAPFFSDDVLSNLVRKHTKFLTKAYISLPWVHEVLQENREKIKNATNRCPWDKNIYGYSVPIDAETVLKDSGKARDKKTSKPQRLYLHLFWDQERFAEEEQRLKNTLFEYEMIVKEKEFVEAPEFLQRAIEKYFDIYLLGDVDDEEAEAEFDVGLKEDVYAKTIEDYGYFALISSSTKDCFAALEKVRFKYEIEGLFMDTYCGHFEDIDDLRGLQFCQFVLVGYYCFIRQKIMNLKESLQKDLQNTELDKQCIEGKEDLLKWLNKDTLLNTLEQIELTQILFLNMGNPIKDPSERERNVKRENLFLRLLGVPS